MVIRIYIWDEKIWLAYRAFYRSIVGRDLKILISWTLRGLLSLANLSIFLLKIETWNLNKKEKEKRNRFFFNGFVSCINSGKPNVLTSMKKNCSIFEERNYDELKSSQFFSIYFPCIISLKKKSKKWRLIGLRKIVDFFTITNDHVRTNIMHETVCIVLKFHCFKQISTRKRQVYSNGCTQRNLKAKAGMEEANYLALRVTANDTRCCGNKQRSWNLSRIERPFR